MHITSFIGMSVNGIIADTRGKEDFLSDTIWQLFLEQVRATNSVILGRRAYEGLLTWPEQYLHALDSITKIVLSHSLTTHDNTWLVAANPAEAIELCLQNKLSALTVGGGSDTTASFLEEGLINDIVVAIEPILRGEGKPAISPSNFENKLKLISQENIGMVQKLTYQIIR